MPRKLCSHGLADSTEIKSRTIYEDYEEGTRLVLYEYFCKDHESLGVFSIDTPFENLTKDPDPRAL